LLKKKKKIVITYNPNKITGFVDWNRIS